MMIPSAAFARSPRVGSRASWSITSCRSLFDGGEVGPCLIGLAQCQRVFLGHMHVMPERMVAGSGTASGGDTVHPKSCDRRSTRCTAPRLGASESVDPAKKPSLFSVSTLATVDQGADPGEIAARYAVERRVPNAVDLLDRSHSTHRRSIVISLRGVAAQLQLHAF